MASINNRFYPHLLSDLVTMSEDPGPSIKVERDIKPDREIETYPYLTSLNDAQYKGEFKMIYQYDRKGVAELTVISCDCPS